MKSSARNEGDLCLSLLRFDRASASCVRSVGSRHGLRGIRVGEASFDMTAVDSSADEPTQPQHGWSDGSSTDSVREQEPRRRLVLMSGNRVWWT